MKDKQPKDMAISQRIDHYVGEKIKERRTMLGLRQEDIARELGITYQQLQKYEKGLNRVSAGKLYMLGEILGVEVSYFYQGLQTPSNIEEHNYADVASDIRAEVARLSQAYSFIKNSDVKRALEKFLSS